MAIDSILSLWQFVSTAVSLLMLGVWIAGFVLSLWVMRWYASAGGCLALGTGLPAISALVSGITQAILLAQMFSDGTIYANGDSELVQILTLTNMVCSMLSSVGIVALIAGIWLLAKRCRELQLAD
jgi:hypothetical protein